MKSKSQTKKFKQTEIGMIPEDWEIAKLKDLLYIKGRIGWKGLKKSEFGQEGIIIINGPDIQDGKINWNGCLRVPKWRYEESKEIIVREGDILITKDGTIGKTAFIKSLPEPATLASGIFLIRVSSKKLNVNFLYQYFSSNFFKNIVESRIEGSVVPHLYQRDIEELFISLPPLSEQRAIASILSSFDDKIELNQRMNKTLEAIGQAIFKHWFVDFEFPNEEGKPYKSSGGEMVYNEELGKEIPKGWKVGFLGDGFLTNIVKPGIEKFEGEKIYLDTACVQDTKIVKLDTKITYYKRPLRANMQPKTKTIWFAKMKDSKKKLFFDEYSEYGLKNFILSTGFAGLEVKDYSLSYIWNFILSDKFETEKDNLCQGTTMQAINNENITKIKILIPQKENLLKFEELMKSISHLLVALFQNSRTLESIRDALLPKLMSGKIRVPVEAEA